MLKLHGRGGTALLQDSMEFVSDFVKEKELFEYGKKLFDTKILAILKQAESGLPVPEICREHGISNATFYNWRSKYGGMDAS